MSTLHSYRRHNTYSPCSIVFISYTLGDQGTDMQWHSQALKTGWAQKVWGTKVPQRGPGWTPGKVRGRSPQKPDIHVYRQFAAVKCMLFYAGLLPSPSSFSPILPQRLFGSDESHNPTWPVRDRVGTCLHGAHPSPVATLLLICELVVLPFSPLNRVYFIERCV